MKFFQKKKKELNLYFGLMLEGSEGRGMILSVDKEHNNIEILDEKHFIYTNGFEAIVEDVDDLLLSLEKMNKVEIENVIFFVDGEMVENSKVIQPYLDSLKKISKELNLKPLGYIQSHEALSLYMERKEEIPFSAAVIECTSKTVQLYIYKKGVIEFEEKIEVLDNIGEKLEEAFATYKNTFVLPSRILIYSLETANSILPHILSHQWKEQTFIQLPHISVIPYHEMKQTFIDSFASQLLDSNTVEETSPVEEDAFVAETKVEREEETTDEIAAAGFVIGKDLQMEQGNEESNTFESDVDDIEKLPRKKLFPSFSVPMFIKNIKLPSIFKPPNKIPFVGVGLIILLLAITFICLYFHTAEITYSLKNKIETKNISLTGVVGNPESDQLQINKITDQVIESDTVTTTGKKTIGESAKGEVTIFNRTESEKVFKSGTIFKANNLQYTLDSDVKIASASQTINGDNNILIVTGKSKANITASAIGPEGNIEKDVKFSIEDFPQSSFFASSNIKFGGGTKKDIRTVSKTDIDTLKKNVINKIKEHQKSQNKQVSGGVIIEPLTTVTLSKEDYSKELGEEAQSVTLKATGSIEYFAYDKKQISSLLKSEFNDLETDSFKIIEDGYVLSFKNQERKDDTIKLDVEATAKAKKDINHQILIKSITGKNSNEADTILKTDPGIERFAIDIKTFIPFLKQRLPFFSKHIILREE